MLLSLAQWLFAILTGASLVYYLVSIYAASRFFSKPPVEPSAERPPVTVLIPLCGADLEGYENYLAVCRQDYPVVQIVFGVQDQRDAAIPIVERLMRDFPHMDIVLVVSDEVIGENPKVNNLQNMLARAKHDVILIMDSDIRLPSGLLSRIAPQLLENKVGIVTCFYRVGKAWDLPSQLEAVGITGEFALGVLTAWWIEGVSFALGAVMVTTQTRLQSIGGFKALGDYLADDFMLGHLLWRAGYEVRLAPEVVLTLPPPVGFVNMLRHQVRWGRGIRACRPMGHLGSIVTHGTVMALVNVAVHAGSSWTLLLGSAVLGARLAAAWFVGVRCLGDVIMKGRIWLVPLRDLFSFWIWCMSVAGRRVEWRGKRYVLLGDGRIFPLK